ncbi:division/cell wall cluster transcriptional repressor MraZ [bacterium]|jgi:MraZ protein|nr:division/cell wall cluster transcriptional repressor MraZ [bacterium]MBT4928035.1 division/cell wall cluster transcriptional repressor MraZ [bacterium]MBT5733536.1 division/cell wall cluster transcriptional repressor MraZ [bacterium]MBT6018994.1 division/cell wall cluster transcriptional repressor MraZ [bacterium]MBT6776909.1 division/cell wall cluster transcriptional repressor MraZ [bacterium]
MTLNKDTFTGEYQYSLDSKGRVNIPAKFRQALSKKNQNTFVATRGQDPCVWIYPLTEWKKIEDELRNLSSVSGIHRTFIRQIARSATPSTCDKQGRITLSPSLISFSQIDKNALIIGMINKIEIWNPETLKAVDEKNMIKDSVELNSLADKIVI